MHSKGRSNGHSGGENGRFKVLLTWSRPALYQNLRAERVAHNNNNNNNNNKRCHR